MVLVWHEPFLVRHADGCVGSWLARVCVRLAGISLTSYRRLSVDHDAGDDLRTAAGILPQ